MNKNTLSRAIILAVLTIGFAMPMSGAQAADPAAYRNCTKSCQSQYANCYKRTKNRTQCQAQQADCVRGCASYLSSLKARILALVIKKEDNKKSR